MYFILWVYVKFSQKEREITLKRFWLLKTYRNKNTENNRKAQKRHENEEVTVFFL